MTFTRFVEVGRVVLINYGVDKGKLATILDVVDSKRVLIDGPQSITGVHRQVISLKCISLTDVHIEECHRNFTQKKLTEKWNEQSILATWEKSAWAKKIASKKVRASLSDFERFKLMIARKQKSKIISEKLASMK